jgi:hypothetical protein
VEEQKKLLKTMKEETDAFEKEETRRRGFMRERAKMASERVSISTETCIRDIEKVCNATGVIIDVYHEYTQFFLSLKNLVSAKDGEKL